MKNRKKIIFIVIICLVIVAWFIYKITKDDDVYYNMTAYKEIFNGENYIVCVSEYPNAIAFDDDDRPYNVRFFFQEKPPIELYLYESLKVGAFNRFPTQNEIYQKFKRYNENSSTKSIYYNLTEKYEIKDKENIRYNVEAYGEGPYKILYIYSSDAPEKFITVAELKTRPKKIEKLYDDGTIYCYRLRNCLTFGNREEEIYGQQGIKNYSDKEIDEIVHQVKSGKFPKKPAYRTPL